MLTPRQFVLLAFITLFSSFFSHASGKEKRGGAFLRMVGEQTSDQTRLDLVSMKEIGLDWAIFKLEKVSSQTHRERFGQLLDSCPKGLSLVLFPSLEWIRSLDEDSDWIPSYLELVGEIPLKKWGRYQDRPVVFLPSAKALKIEETQTSIDRLRKGLDSLLETPCHLIGDPSWGDAVDSRIRYGGSLVGPTPIDDSVRSVTVGPGFDPTILDTLPGRLGVRMREEGAFYTWSWSQVIDQDVDIVIIETWNDFETQTQIVPDRRYGYQYLDLTQKGIDRWRKDQSLPAASPKWPTPIPQEKRLFGWELREEHQVRFATEAPYSKGVIAIGGTLGSRHQRRVLISEQQQLSFDIADAFHFLPKNALDFTLTFVDEKEDSKPSLDIQLELGGKIELEESLTFDDQGVAVLQHEAFLPDLSRNLKDLVIRGSRDFAIASIHVNKAPHRGLGFTRSLPTQTDWPKSFDPSIWRAMRVQVSWRAIQEGRLSVDEIINEIQRIKKESIFAVVAIADRPLDGKVGDLQRLMLQIASKGRGWIDGFEILVHPNTSYGFARPSFVDRYIALIRKVARELHRIDPTLWIASGAILNRDWDFATLLRSGDRSLSLDALTLAPTWPSLLSHSVGPLLRSQRFRVTGQS